MKKLPEIFKNNENRLKNNNQQYYYSLYEKEGNRGGIPIDINNQLDEIFRDIRHCYSDTFLIKTKDRIYRTNIIERKEKEIISIDNDRILIDTILSIEKIT